MTQKERMAAGKLYTSADPQLRSEHLKAKERTRKYNATLETEDDLRKEMLKEILGSAGENAFVEPPFHCDYGINTYVGKNFYANYNFTLLDTADVTIGDEVMCGPNVSIFAASHPIDPVTRASGLECGRPVKIGDYVWIGGNSVICPGVTIGNNVVIGAGSVVCKDIPDNVVAAGNPCSVIREISDEEKQFWRDQAAEWYAECKMQNAE